jgi:ABC-2 type transport system permease protein
MAVAGKQLYAWPARKSLAGELADIVRHRDLLLLLVQKDLKVKYKGAALGFLWSLLNPLLMMLVYTVVWSFIARFPIHNYQLFVLSGLLPWNAFSTVIPGATASLVGNSNLVRRMRFPLEFLPITPVLSGVVNLLLSLCLLVIFAIVLRQPLGLPLLTLPILLILQVVMTSGFALVLSAVLVYFRDVEYLITIGLTAWFFLTPVIYPLSALRGHGKVALLIGLNPLTWLVGGYQAIWHANAWPDWGSLGALAVFSFVMLLVGRFVFRRLEPRFAEEV